MTPSARRPGGAAARLRGGWDRFWYAEGSPVALSLFRIVFGLCLWREWAVSRSQSLPSVADGRFHLPYASLVPLLPERAFELVHDLQLAFIGLLIAGAFRRTTCGALLLLQGWVFFADQLTFRNHPYLFLLLLVPLGLGPSTDALSIDAGVRALRGRRPLGASLLGSSTPIVWQRCLCVQVAIVYLYAGLHKLNAAFLGGHVLSHYLARSLPREAERWLGAGPATLERLAAFASEPANLVPAAVLSAALELALPFALFARRSRPFAMAVGVPFHLGIAAAMDVWTFSFAMIGSYLLFLDPATRGRPPGPRRPRRAGPPPPR